MAKLMPKGGNFVSFYNSLPDVLAASSFKKVVEAIRAAKKKHKPVIFFMGAHVLKCGLSPLINALIRKGFITHLAGNGATLIHDFELAFQGETSEEVEKSLPSGKFGMVKETAAFLNNCAILAAANGRGLACTVGGEIEKGKLPNRGISVYAECARSKITSSAHVGIGTDIIYQHPACDGGAWGEASYRDFKTLVGVVANLGRGGVVLNFGSAVICPEVFLKALSVARNLKGKIEDFTTASFDMIHQYREYMNITRRPTLKSGKGYYIIGHHEIMLPLLAASLQCATK
ncbi:MAG: hypothetical protein PHE61_06435 [Candidatus Omnitrophica bacterium]|nr:hypothetical protein [Candidatus Omnitrophota bacterium]